MNISTFINPWLVPLYGLLGSAFTTLSVLGDEGLQSYLMLVGAAWAMIVLPVNLILLFPVIGLTYYFVKSAPVSTAIYGFCSIVSMAAGLFSLDAIMSV